MTDNFIAPEEILFCNSCGAKTEYIVPDGDNRKRHVCCSCHKIQYQNPLNVVGVIPRYKNKILLCKRNIEPRLGKWTLPAGFLELNETLAQGAIRETHEEAGVEIELKQLFAIIEIPRADQIHYFFLADITRAELNFGHETSEVKFFTKDEIPWSELSFSTVIKTLEWYNNKAIPPHQLNDTYFAVI